MTELSFFIDIDGVPSTLDRAWQCLVYRKEPTLYHASLNQSHVTCIKYPPAIFSRFLSVSASPRFKTTHNIRESADNQPSRELTSHVAQPPCRHLHHRRRHSTQLPTPTPATGWKSCRLPVTLLRPFRTTILYRMPPPKLLLSPMPSGCPSPRRQSCGCPRPSSSSSISLLGLGA